MRLPVHVDPKDPLPLYAQLERGIRIGIATGNIKPGQQLPTVRQLAVDLRVNANTVARVYLALERDGVLTTRRGVGTFVAEGVPQKTNAPYRERRLRQAIDRFLTEATSLGYKPREVVRALARRIREGE
ncbi:MAG TPA: GntR family transcriptional regulator [Thermoanaerobaculia bacterium]|jgi:GntR family transcriptional regulator